MTIKIDNKKICICLLLVFAAVTGYVFGRLPDRNSDVRISEYDPNDVIYQYIPPAPELWRDEFGDNERTRLLHSISEIRTVVANQGGKLREIEKILTSDTDTNTAVEPNDTN